MCPYGFWLTAGEYFVCSIETSWSSRYSKMKGTVICVSSPVAATGKMAEDKACSSTSSTSARSRALPHSEREEQPPVLISDSTIAQPLEESNPWAHSLGAAVHTLRRTYQSWFMPYYMMFAVTPGCDPGNARGQSQSVSLAPLLEVWRVGHLANARAQPLPTAHHA